MNASRHEESKEASGWKAAQARKRFTLQTASENAWRSLNWKVARKGRGAENIFPNLAMNLSI